MRSSPLVRISRSGSCISGAYKWRRKSSSVSPAVERHEQRDAVVVRGHALSPVDALLELRGDALATPDEAHPHAFLVELGGLPVDPLGDHRHQRVRSEEHTSELQSPDHLVCRLLLEKKKKNRTPDYQTQKRIQSHKHSR